MKKITVYDKYIFTQVLITTIVAILLFTIVWIAPEMLLNTIKKVLAGDYTAKTGVLILLYEIPKILGKAFPVGLLLGSLFTFDKLSKDSELTIFRAVGMSFKRILAPLLVLSLIVTYLCFLTYDKWIPYSCQKLQEIRGSKTLTQFIYTQKDENNNPTQAVIVPINSEFDGYAKEVQAKMLEKGMRVEVDCRNETMGKRIREAQLEKVNYVVVIGANEVESGTVSLRARGGINLGVMSIDDMVNKLSEEIESKAR